MIDPGSVRAKFISDSKSNWFTLIAFIGSICAYSLKPQLNTEFMVFCLRT